MAGKTFKDVAEAFIDRKEGGWRNDKHRQQWRNSLATYVYPHFGDMPVAQIETEHVLNALEPIWGVKAETASRVRGRIENVLDAAKVQCLRSGENVARWRGHLEHLLPKPGKLTRGHHPALPYDALPTFMAALRQRGEVGARALEFTILTVARSGEVLGATWGEIDLEKAQWTVPAERMKAGKEHSIPLAPRAVDILRLVQPLNLQLRADAPLFPNSKGRMLSSMAMSMVLRRMDRGDITVHGFRSTFRDWAGETTSFPREVVEHAMAHQLADKAEAAYQRGTLFPKRIKLMDAWGEYCGSPLS
ncbi:MAG: tyrosine-type recombinase/integrase [Chakrabartia sp.]